VEAIITAIIGGVCVAIPSIIATVSSNKKSAALITYRVDQLEKKVEKHNSVVERTFRLEEDIKHIKESIKELKHS
jgi:hypothetical protein